MVRFTKLTPNLKVNDLRTTIQFYQEFLGYELVMAVPESQDTVEFTLRDEGVYVYALMKHEQTELMFQRADTFQFLPGTSTMEPGSDSVVLYFDVTKLQSLHDQLSQTNMHITPIHNTWYGMREFYFRDVNGYVLGFAEKI